jgi:hypothetical protein
LAAELSESVKKVPEFAEFRGNFAAFEDQKSAAKWAENGKFVAFFGGVFDRKMGCF